jgi:F-type H+-transporting ATPase subunit beta
MKSKTHTSEPKANHGAVIAVRGSVIDAVFPHHLPALDTILRTGEDQQIVIEVAAHLAVDRVRGIALTTTRGLARGSSILDTGLPLRVPVGAHVLGRVFNVFGETIDDKGAITHGEWRSIHRPPIPLAQRTPTSEIFTTGIKTIDVLAPLERGGKAGLFGGAGVGKTVLLMELWASGIIVSPKRREAPWRSTRISRILSPC